MFSDVFQYFHLSQTPVHVMKYNSIVSYLWLCSLESCENFIRQVSKCLCCAHSPLCVYPDRYALLLHGATGAQTGHASTQCFYRLFADYPPLFIVCILYYFSTHFDSKFRAKIRGSFLEESWQWLPYPVLSNL